MTEASEQRAKMVLKSLIQKSRASFSAETVIKEFKKPRDLTTQRRLVQVVKKISKNNPVAEKLFEDFVRNMPETDAYQNLLNFLNNYADYNTEVTVGNNESTIPTEPPPLCSTKIDTDQITPKTVSEIRKRIVEAASGGLSKSAQGSSVNPTHSPTTTPISESIRPSSLWYFSQSDTYQMQSVAAIPIASQERIIIADLLFCLIGIRGSFITPIETTDHFAPIKFNISDQIHCSLRDIVMEILPLASHYSLIQQFIQQTSTIGSGQVLQALSTALRSLMYDYYMSLVQLETEHVSDSLSLQRFLFMVRPTMATLAVLAETVTEIHRSEMRGAKVLTILFDKIASLTGDTISHNIVIHLTERASVPFIETLELWILTGVIIDPHQEFLIQDNEIVSRTEVETNHYSADYWEKRYTIRRDRIPRFLDAESDMILRTGKYLNVIRQCGKIVQPPIGDRLEFTPANQNHIHFIRNAYHFASRTLLEVLMKENDLMGHLLSVKRYFLLYQGDFITHFMDASEEELSKNVHKCLPMKLDSLLGLTLRLSCAKHDPHKDDLHCHLFPFELVKQMAKIHLAGTNEDEDDFYSSDNIDLTALECFTFEYDVKWPVSLVLNHFAMSEYQMIFRQLFFCKHVERQLCKAWNENVFMKKYSTRSAELYRSAFTLRQRMMNAIQNLESYMMIEIIEPTWHIFIEKMNRVENVDDVLIIHHDFLDTCLQNCMLKNPDLLRVIIKLCKTCLAFCKLINSDVSQTPATVAKFSDSVRLCQMDFDEQIIGLLKSINDLSFGNSAGKFINLVHRINFNSFYSNQLETQ